MTSSPPTPSPLARWGDALVALGALAFGAFVPLGIAGIQIAFGVAFAGLLLRRAGGGTGLRGTPYDGPVVLHVLVALASIALTTVAGDPGPEPWNVWRLVAIPILVTAFAERRVARRAAWAVVAAAFVMGPYAVLQSFTGADWLRPGHPIRYAANLVAGRYRPTGTLNAYPSFAFVTVVALGFAFALGLEQVRGRGRRLLLAGAALPALAGLAFTQVRAAWAGLLAGLVVAAWLRSRRLVLGVVGASLALGLVLGAVSPAVRAKARTTFDLGYNHNSERVFMWVRAMEAAHAAPALGIGHGTWTPATRRIYDRTDAAFGGPRCHAHNNFLQMWATTGPMGLVAFVWLFVAFFALAIPAYRAARRREDRLAAALALGGVVAATAFLVYSVPQDPWFDGEPFYALVLGLTLAAAAGRWTGTWRPRLPRPAEVLGVAVPALLGVLVGGSQAFWTPPPGRLTGFVSGPGGAVRLGVLVAVAVMAAFVALSPGLRRALRRDRFAWSLVLAAAVVAAGHALVSLLLAPRTADGLRLGLPDHLSLAVPLSALTAILAALVARAAALAPVGWPAAVATATLAVGAGGVVRAAWAPAILTPLSRSGPQVAGADDRRPVDPDRPSPVVRIDALGAAPCRAVVLGPRAVLTTTRCAGIGRATVRAGDATLSCFEIADRAMNGLATLRCRLAADGRDLADLVGAPARLATRPPETDRPLRYLDETSTSACAVGRLDPDHGTLEEDCDGDGPPGGALLQDGRVVGLHVDRTRDGHHLVALTAPLLEGDDQDPGGGDGVPDGVDDCLWWNPSQADTDRDGLGDACAPLSRPAPLGDGAVVTTTRQGRVERLVLGGAAPAVELLEDPFLRRYGAPLTTGRFRPGRGREIAVAAVGSGDLLLLDATGAAAARADYALRTRWTHLAAGDLDGGGRELLVAVRQPAGQAARLTVFTLDGARWRVRAEAALPGEAPVRALAVGDLDGDGQAEIVAARGGPAPAPRPWDRPGAAKRGAPSVERWRLGPKGLERVATSPAPAPVAALALVSRPGGPGRLVLAYADGRLGLQAGDGSAPSAALDALAARDPAWARSGAGGLLERRPRLPAPDWILARPTADGIEVWLYARQDPRLVRRRLTLPD